MTRAAVLPPAVTVHGLAQARAALAPGLPVLLLSGPGAASYGGALWWRKMIGLALDGRHAPDALDCSDEPGRALEALAAGCRIIVLLPCPAFASVADRAGETLVLRTRPVSLDLEQPGNSRRLLAWLSPPGAGVTTAGGIG